jgi:hypothetical protein
MVKGFNGQISLENNCVMITRKGFFGFATRAGDVTIPLERISYVQLKKPGLTRGFINIVMAGSPEIKTVEQALTDSSCVIMGMGQYQSFVELKDKIEKQMRAPKKTVIETDAMTALEKLSTLKEKGIISEAEFQEKKTELLKRI